MVDFPEGDDVKSASKLKVGDDDGRICRGSLLSTLPQTGRKEKNNELTIINKKKAQALHQQSNAIFQRANGRFDQFYDP